jgi:hypothetical protein
MYKTYEYEYGNDFKKRFEFEYGVQTSFIINLLQAGSIIAGACYHQRFTNRLFVTTNETVTNHPNDLFMLFIVILMGRSCKYEIIVYCDCTSLLSKTQNRIYKKAIALCTFNSPEL